MNAFSKDDMLKATQLTRAGRLKEALSVIRSAIGAPKPAQAAPAAAPDFLERLENFARQVVAPKQALPAHAQGSRFETRKFASEAGKRTYKLYIPNTHRGQDAPLIVMLHGCTQNPDDFATGTGMNDIAEAEGFLVAYPAQSGSANMQKCWNWYNPADQHRGAGEPAIIAGITRAVAAEFSVQPGRIFVAGLSAGGAMAATLGATYPDLFAAIGVHSGLACGAATDMTSAFTAMRRGGGAAKISGATSTEPAHPIPTIVFHGTKDHTVNPVNADQVITHAQIPGFTETTAEGEANGLRYTRTIQTGPGGKPVTEKWLLQGAGHAWSGGNPAGSFTSKAGPSASQEMVRFFKETGQPKR
jgi:poly(hydroxyalkanoate) depolymerase family esterase